MNKLQAINEMLACIGQTPISSLQGNKTARTVIAENILDNEIESTQLLGWYFNTEHDYRLHPDEDEEIVLPINTLKVDVIRDLNEYVQRGGRLYNLTQHTFKIKHPVTATIVFKLTFDELPPSAQKFITMNAANKFVAKTKESQDAYAFTQVEVDEAKAALLQAECDTGGYSMLDMFSRKRAL